MPSRFDYVKYDSIAVDQQNMFKNKVTELEQMIELTLPASPRSKALALTKLEEVYMWIGKGLRDAQLLRNGTVELQEERKDG